MPYYREVLLSAWPSDIVFDVGAPPIKPDPAFLATLQDRGFALVGPNTRGLRRNQVEDTRSVEQAPNALRLPRFLSEIARASGVSPAGTPAPEEVVPGPPHPLPSTGIESLKIEVPSMYQKVDIQYSRFGIDDFDFKWALPSLLKCLLNYC